jgi:hypothetical protein
MLASSALMSPAAEPEEARETADAPPSEVPTTPPAHLQAERQAVLDAMELAAAGNHAAAWALLTADVADGRVRMDGVSPARLGWRATTVAGFLRNQSKYDEAGAFARFALAQSWCDLERIGQAKERARIFYWSALLAADFAGDRDRALEWIARADAEDPDSEPIMELRQRLAEAAISFPRGNQPQAPRP